MTEYLTNHIIDKLWWLITVLLGLVGLLLKLIAKRFNSKLDAAHKMASEALPKQVYDEDHSRMIGRWVDTDRRVQDLERDRQYLRESQDEIKQMLKDGFKAIHEDSKALTERVDRLYENWGNPRSNYSPKRE